MARGRVLLAVVVTSVLASVGALLHGAAEAGRLKTAAEKEVLRAQRFELVDSHGRVRAVLGMTAVAVPPTSFKIIDRDGKEIIVPRDQIVIEGTPVREPGEAPGISLFDEAGRPRARVWLGPDGTPYLEMTAADGAVIFAVPHEGRVEMLRR